MEGNARSPTAKYLSICIKNSQLLLYVLNINLRALTARNKSSLQQSSVNILWTTHKRRRIGSQREASLLLILAAGVASPVLATLLSVARPCLGGRSRVPLRVAVALVLTWLCLTITRRPLSNIPQTHSPLNQQTSTTGIAIYELA